MHLCILSVEVRRQIDDAAEEGGPQLSVHGHGRRHQRLQLHDGRGSHRGRSTHTSDVGEKTAFVLNLCNLF